MTEETPSPAQTFGEHAAGYDAMRRGLVPCFDDFYGTALDLVDDWLVRERGEATALRVLDLGAGTGLFAALLLARHPRAQLRLLDASEGMLAQARQRFRDRPEVEYVLGDLASVDLAGPWDLAVSALAIHHLRDGEKRDLFGRVRRALFPGGLFVNAEQVAGPDPATDARYLRFWHRQIRERGVPEGEIARAAQRMAHDRCASLADQLAWLRAAGFNQVDCSYQAWRFAVLSGRA